MLDVWMLGAYTIPTLGLTIGSHHIIFIGVHVLYALAKLRCITLYEVHVSRTKINIGSSKLWKEMHFPYQDELLLCTSPTIGHGVSMVLEHDHMLYTKH